MKWQILLPQLPASPSTLRVMVWRRMRDAGALGLQNGVWLLPDTPDMQQVIDELQAYLKEHTANAYVFKVDATVGPSEEDILDQLRAERDQEYTEFIERCDVLLEDLEHETRQERFGYAELEEAEADLKKLETWWAKCSQRDFVGGQRRPEAKQKLETSQQSCQDFAAKVYARHGLEDGEDASSPES